MDGQIESAVVTHRPSGARCVLTATLEHGGDLAPVNVRSSLDDGFVLVSDGDWKYARFGADAFRFRVGHEPQPIYTGLPTWLIDAPRVFHIKFVVERPHPARPARAHTAREYRRA